MYSCPMEKKTPEPSPEVLEEIKHQKEIKEITRSTQKLVFELQHSKMKLALLKLTREIDSLTISTAPLETSADTVIEEEIVHSEESALALETE